MPTSARLAPVVCTDAEEDLDLIARPEVQAVIYTPAALPAWISVLAEAVEAGEFQIPRTTLYTVTRSLIAEWLSKDMPKSGISSQVRCSLIEDILALPNKVEALLMQSRLQLRIFTAAPTVECGFHVDTVPASAETVGVLRVYNGAGTIYIDPEDIKSIGDFYAYLRRRERIRGEYAQARNQGRQDLIEAKERELVWLDANTGFLKPEAQMKTVPSGSIVVFRHLDARHHWELHERTLAWIHSSPAVGKPRLVVNVAAGQVTDLVTGKNRS